MAMTDEQLAAFLGIDRLSWPHRTRIMLRITPAERALYEQMAIVEAEVELWRAGRGPKPRGVIICERGGSKR